MDSGKKNDNSRTSKPKIIIIGAGISGIAAGEFLSRKGFTDFQILEATGRTGGRIWSVSVDDDGHKAELGANWIHGIERNPIFQIADQNHLLQLRHADHTLKRHDLYLMESGKHISEKIVKEVDFSYGMLIQQCEDFFVSGIPTADENDSVGDYLVSEFEEKLEKYSNGDRLVRRLIFNQRLLLECCISGCDKLEEVSLSEFGSYEELPGVHYTIPPGFEAILEILKKNIPEKNVCLNKPVKCVTWDKLNEKSGQVCVECEDGEKFYANHVITTVSLGVLKAACDRMFVPALPKDKKEAIQSLGFGIVNKVILEFDEPVVDSDIFRIHLLWEPQDNGPGSDLRSTWYRKMYSFEVVHDHVLIGDQVQDRGKCNGENNHINSRQHGHQLLMGWLSGNQAIFMESLTEEEIADDCVEILKKFLQKKDIPRPKRVLRTRWGSNQYTRGSYSFIAVGSYHSYLETLMEPLTPVDSDVPRVLFAGEATHPTFYSTTHGALLSGYREAQRIISLYSQ